MLGNILSIEEWSLSLNVMKGRRFFCCLCIICGEGPRYTSVKYTVVSSGAARPMKRSRTAPGTVANIVPVETILK